MRARAAGDPARRGRHLRRAGRARRRARRGARGRQLLRAQPARRSSCRATASSRAGGLGSYGSYGLAYKRRLLELEGAPLSEDLRNELAAIAPEADCDRLAELSGLFHVAGSVHLRGRGNVDAASRSRQLGGRAPRLRLLRAFDVESEIRTYQQHAFARATRYQLHVEGTPHAYETLHRAGVLDSSHRPLERPPQRVVARRCCRGAYLRGALLGAGSLSGPRDPHLEIRSAELEGARFLAEVAARAGAELHVLDRGRARRRVREGSASAIADALVAAGATDIVLVLEESSVLAAIRADANRLANADHANLVRTSRAAHAQLEALRKLDLDALPEDLRELASLRLRHPTSSIADLARRCRPPTTKASAYRRLRRLQQLAGDYVRLTTRLARPGAVVILDNGGSALVRLRIQTPSVATVSGVVQGPGGSSSELPGPPALVRYIRLP